METPLPELKNEIIKLTGLDLAPIDQLAGLENSLAVYINELILHDFNKLVSLLYRIDINESKLKNLLQTNPDTDAGIMIAKMIIDRQLQKIELRKSFKSERESDEERW